MRLTNRFLAKREDKVSAEVFEQMCHYVRTKAVHVLSRSKRLCPVELIASSGTALALQNVAFRLEHGFGPNDEQTTLSLSGLKKAAKHICNLTASERYALPGISIRRAQVLVAGAAILQTLMEELNFEELTVSTRNLQDGTLVNYLRNTFQEQQQSVRSVREQSILQLAKRCHFEEHHATHIANLTLQMHDSAVDCGLISFNHRERELLYYSTLVHDIGIFISYARHAAHGAYLIRNAELLGFNEEEIHFIAGLIRYHNVKPSKKYEDFLKNSKKIKQQIFCLFISLAENMDRLHCQHVQEVYFKRKNDSLILNVASLSKSPIEIDAVNSMATLISKAFNAEAEINFLPLCTLGK